MAEKPVSIPGTIKWQPGRVIGGDHTGAAYLYAINRYGKECCLGKWESPEDAKGSPYEREVAEVFAAHKPATEELRGQKAEVDPFSSDWRYEMDGNGGIWSWKFYVGDKLVESGYEENREAAQGAVDRLFEAHRPLPPDECREQGKLPRKMREDEVQLRSGAPAKLEIETCADGEPFVRIGGLHYWPIASMGDHHHLWQRPEQTARAAAFFARNAPADWCLPNDSTGDARTMAPNEVRDVVTGKGLEMYVVTLGAVGIGPKSSSGNAQWLYCPPRTAEQHITAHPCSLPSNRLRVEAFLAASANPDRWSEGDRSGLDAVLPEAHSGSPSGEKCERCEGAGWLYGHELDEPEDPPTDQHYDCPTCNGTGKWCLHTEKTEESDGCQSARGTEPTAGLPEGRATSDEVVSLGDAQHPEQGTANQDGSGTSGEVDRKPEGVPASATVWAEVVDGLGRRVGAWFGEYRDGSPCVYMHDPDGKHTMINRFVWAPDVDAHWTHGAANQAAAAQCRQLYERGMAEQAEIKAWAENMAGFVCDESIDTGAKAAAALSRPACIPANIPDTNWTVIEGQKAEEKAPSPAEIPQPAHLVTGNLKQDVVTRPLPSGAQLRKALADAVNGCSAENGSDTPDHVLGDFLADCLMALDSAINKRDLLASPEHESAVSSPADGRIDVAGDTERRHVEALFPDVSPADGPAKVFGREPLRTGNVSSDEATHELDIGALMLSWFEDGKVYIDTRDDWHDGEALTLSILAALLTYATPEQVVQAMGEETREAIGVLLMPWCMSEITKTRGQRDEALARAEKAEYRASVEETQKLRERDYANEQRARAEKAEAELAALKKRYDVALDIAYAPRRTKTDDDLDIATTRLALERGLVDGYRSLLAEARSSAAERDQASRERMEARPPVPMVLHCPECRARHIDEGEFATKPHHTHSCQACGLTWRPAVVATVGVQFLPGFKNGGAP